MGGHLPELALFIEKDKVEGVVMALLLLVY